ncbi:Organic cation transporter protein [Armadillidium nasatum]|uniref:Organic cation transporter protein n=1 Tax=Armadillidium nasatum TaxID=96803 RepID=A0A5N5TPM9_9CRUS|nr:Organic cation transporter protein [Armadillidium nasatum]
MEKYLEDVGEFGQFQIQNFILLSLPTIVVAMQKYAWVFLGAKVKHRCQLPWEEVNANYSLPVEELELYFPRDRNTDNGFSQCTIFKEVKKNWNSSLEIESCSNFIYDRSEYESSAVIDYNLVCGRSWMRSTVQSLFMVGTLFGSNFFGHLSDRFLLGATLQGIFLIAYVIMMEMVGKTKRVVVGILAHAFYSIAFFTGALIAYLVTSWRWLQVAYTLPAILFIPYYWIISESARWLSAKGKSEEAKNILKKVAQTNGKKVSEESLEMAIQVPEGEKGGNFFDLFRYKSLRLKTCIFFIGCGAVEIPGLLFSLYIIEKVGRKLPLCGMMCTGGVALLIGLFLDKNSIEVAILSYIGKMCISGSYAIIYTFTAESFPTVVRNVAVGSSSMVASVGGALATYVNLLGDFWPPLPYIIFGLSSFLSGVLCLMLKETKGNPMDDLIQEKIQSSRGEENRGYGKENSA